MLKVGTILNGVVAKGIPKVLKFNSASHCTRRNPVTLSHCVKWRAVLIDMFICVAALLLNSNPCLIPSLLDNQHMSPPLKCFVDFECSNSEGICTLVLTFPVKSGLQLRLMSHMALNLHEATPIDGNDGCSNLQ